LNTPTLLNNQILDALSGHIAVLDKKGTIIYVNQSWVNFSIQNNGSNRDDIGVNYLDVVKKAIEFNAESQLVYDEIIKVINRKKDYFYIDYACHSPNEERWYTMRVTPIGDNGEVVITHSNITERVLSERESKEINTKLNIVLKGTNTGLWEWDLITNKFMFNREWGLQLGYEYGELEHNFSSWKKLIHPDDKEEAISRTDKYLKGESQSYEFVYRLKHKNGEWIHILTKGFISKRADDGTPVYFMGTHTDVNKEEQYLQEISEYEKYFSVSMDVMSVADGEYFIKTNPKFTEVLGYTKEDLISQPFTNFIHPEDLEKTYSEISKVSSGEPTTQFINRYKCKGGNYKHLMWTAKSDPESGLRYGAARDITDLIEAKEESQQYMDILNSSLNEMYIIDAETLHFIDANIGAQNNIGFTVEELKKYTPIDLKPDIELEDFQRIVEPLISRDKKHITFETRHLRRDGSTYMAFVNVQLTKLGTKDVFVALALDITDRIIQEKELKEIKQNLENIIDYANIGIAYATKDAKLISVNPKFSEILEYENSAELLGKTVFDFTISEDSEKDLNLISEIKKGIRDIFQIEKRYITKNNNIKWVDLHVTGIRDNNNEVINFVAMVSDITERKELDQEKHNAIIKAEEAERQRISYDLHDGLGQKIAAANMCLNTLEDFAKEQLDDEALSIFNTTKKLVNEATKETRLVSHNIMPRSLKQFGLEQSIEDMLSNYRKINEQIKFRLDSNLGNKRFNTDNELAIFRVLQEAISNAIKHSKANKISTKIEQIESKLFIEIKDNGIGFNQNRHDNIKGIGLLSLTQRINMIGGEIVIDSKINEGTTIRIVVPFI
jgi:PAS domain S-box-containing protein